MLTVLLECIELCQFEGQQKQTFLCQHFALCLPIFLKIMLVKLAHLQRIKYIKPTIEDAFPLTGEIIADTRADVIPQTLIWPNGCSRGFMEV